MEDAELDGKRQLWAYFTQVAIISIGSMLGESHCERCNQAAKAEMCPKRNMLDDISMNGRLPKPGTNSTVVTAGLKVHALACNPANGNNKMHINCDAHAQTYGEIFCISPIMPVHGPGRVLRAGSD